MGRIVVAAICGLVFGLGLGVAPLSATPASPRHHKEPKNADPAGRPIAIAPPTTDPGPKDYGCQDRQDRRDSDLCAQWKAADAAKTAADAAWILGVIGTLVGGATLIAAWNAAYWAKAAARHTDNGTKAAWAAEKISREAAQRQLRAYVAAHNIRIENFVVGKRPTILFDLQNTGQTVAKRVRAKANVFWRFGEIYEPVLFPAHFRPATFDMPPGSTLQRSYKWPFQLSQAQFDAFAFTDPVFVYVGIVTYQDVFRVTRRTIWQQKVVLSYLNEGSGPLVPVPSKGNRIT